LTANHHPLRPGRRRSTLRGFGAFCDRCPVGSTSLPGAGDISRSSRSLIVLLLFGSVVNSLAPLVVADDSHRLGDRGRVRPSVAILSAQRGVDRTHGLGAPLIQFQG
jgi:hypothetical protein